MFCEVLNEVFYLKQYNPEAKKPNKISYELRESVQANVSKAPNHSLIKIGRRSIMLQKSVIFKKQFFRSKHYFTIMTRWYFKLDNATKSTFPIKLNSKSNVFEE